MYLQIKQVEMMGQREKWASWHSRTGHLVLVIPIVIFHALMISKLALPCALGTTHCSTCPAIMTRSDQWGGGYILFWWEDQHAGLHDPSDKPLTCHQGESPGVAVMPSSWNCVLLNCDGLLRIVIACSYRP